MRKEIKITIPEPCHEDWNQMTPQQKGRHCAVCEKTVFDFTNKTDEYIVKTFEKESKLCGRFKGQQLDRPLAFSRKDSNNYLAVAASTALAFLTFGTQSANAQGNSQIKTEVSTSNQVKEKIAHSVLVNRVISGYVFGKDNKPLVNAQVLEKGTNNLTVTNEKGHYTIKVNKESTLQFVHENYQDYEIVVANNNSISVEMVEEKSKASQKGRSIITGNIKNQLNENVQNVKIIEAGTTNSAQSDINGNYTIDIFNNSSLIFNHKNHDLLTLKVKKTDTLNINLNKNCTERKDGFIYLGMPVFCDSKNYDYSIIAEKRKQYFEKLKELKLLRKVNNKYFYARKFKEAKAERKLKRQEKRKNKS